MTTDPCRALILESIQLPTTPRIAALVAGVADLEAITAVVAEDPTLAAQVLRVANSALYAVGEPVQSIQRAAIVLGGRTLRRIVLQVEIYQQYEQLRRPLREEFDGLWQHSTFVAQVSQILATKLPPMNELDLDRFYTSGLLHDLGKIVMLASFGEEYLEVLLEVREEGVVSSEREAEVFAFDHGQVGGIVADCWELPNSIIDIVEFHHGPQHMLETSFEVSLIAFADQLAHRIQSKVLPKPAELRNLPAQKLLRLSERALEEVVDMAQETWEQISGLAPR